ncbi:MAG TPA: DUF3025 domain-containing protein [Polyangiaceae bacterium]|nr:DUF3025 domain-containing protein [Polyangiaceae bacterium]
MTTSLRALHRAVQAQHNARFTTDWLARPPYSHFHPAFCAAAATLSDWPEPDQYGALVAAVPQAAGQELPRFVLQDRAALAEAGGYEQHVAALRAVPTRPRHWHDFFNMAVWAHFPAARWALNELHVDARLGPKDPRNGRAPQQNVVAQFDESGLIVTSTSASLLSDLRALRFKRVFWERRAELLETTRFWLIGHGTLESLLAPHLGLACKALLMVVSSAPDSVALPPSDAFRHEVDARAAQSIRSWRAGAPMLDPVPVLGIPGFAANEFGEFYDDARYFRFQRRGERS